jgi:hypothetical protein
MEIFGSLFFLVAVVFFSFVVFKERTPIFILRSIGFILAIAIVFHFNLNWILKIPMSLNIGSLLFLGIAALFLLLDRDASFLIGLRKDITNKKIWIGWLIVLGILGGAFLVGCSYFEGRLNEPRYNTSDPAIHYLYQSSTAKTGLLSMFSPNEIYKAAGSNESYKVYNDSYFPGPATAFYLLGNVFYWIQKITLFQVFNIVFYALVSAYLFLLFVNHHKKRNFLISLFALTVILFGTFFDFLNTSFTSQLLGLFLLLFFIDIFYEYYSAIKISIFIPIIALSGLVLTYVYWLPIAIMFIFFVAFFDIKNARMKNMMKIFFLVSMSSLLSIGYILIFCRLNSVSSATIDGGFPFGPKFLAELIIIIPFALINLYLLLKDKFLHKRERLFTDFSLSVVLYSTILTLAHVFNFASNYVYMKVFYLTVPVVWMLCLLLFFEKVSIESIIALIKKIRKNRFELGTYFSYKQLYFLLGYVVAVSVVTLIMGVDFKIFPLEKNNINLAIRRDKQPNLNSEQMQLLSLIKKDYGFALDDNRVLAITEYYRSIWTYSYSGIWPRPYSLIPNGDRSTIGLSYLAPNSGVDYYQWLLNDENHYLVYMNSSFAKDWVKDSGFDFSDYEKIVSVGKNYLLHLKDNTRTEFIVPKKYPGKKQTDSVNLPYAGEFTSQLNNLSGLSFLLFIPRDKNVLNDYLFELREGSCAVDSAPIVEKIIAKNDLRIQKTNSTYIINFDTIIPESEGKTYCYKLSSKDTPGAVNLARNSKTNDILFQEIHVYIND